MPLQDVIDKTSESVRSRPIFKGPHWAQARSIVSTCHASDITMQE